MTGRGASRTRNRTGVNPCRRPPPHPTTGLTAYFAGFPETSRLWINSREISFGLYVAGGPIGSALLPIVQGTQVWVKYINNKGGVNGHPVRMLLYDDAGECALKYRCCHRDGSS